MGFSFEEAQQDPPAGGSFSFDEAWGAPPPPSFTDRVKGEAKQILTQPSVVAMRGAALEPLQALLTDSEAAPDMAGGNLAASFDPRRNGGALTGMIGGTLKFLGGAAADSVLSPIAAGRALLPGHGDFVEELRKLQEGPNAVLGAIPDPEGARAASDAIALTSAPFDVAAAGLTAAGAPAAVGGAFHAAGQLAPFAFGVDLPGRAKPPENVSRGTEPPPLAPPPANVAAALEKIRPADQGGPFSFEEALGEPGITLTPELAKAVAWLGRDKTSENVSRGTEPAPRPKIPRSPNLTPEHAKVEGDFAERLEAPGGYERAVDDYARLPESKGGKVLNTDIARDLDPVYNASADARSRLAAAVHEPASWLVKQMYVDKLAEDPKPGEFPRVTFTAGGTGAGKSTAIETVPRLRQLTDDSQIVYDTNMNSLESAVKKVEQALDAGKDVHIAYVYRDPVEALTNGALPRAQRQGRTVPLKDHAETHEGSAQTILDLMERYADDPRVEFSIVDNSRGRGNAVVSNADFVRQMQKSAYNDLVPRLRSALDQAKEEGIDVNGNHEPLADRVYEGTAGSYADGATGGAAGQAVGRGSEARPSEAVPEKAQPAGGDVDGRSPEREARAPGDERAGVEPPKPGEKFLVYRIGAKPLLENRNAGNADAIARHLADTDDPTSGIKAEGQTVNVFEVTAPEAFGKYAGTVKGRAVPEGIGRVVRKNEIAYSFGPGTKGIRHVKSIPLAELRARLKAAGHESFDDAGTNEGARIVREMANERGPEAKPENQTPKSGQGLKGSKSTLIVDDDEIPVTWEAIEAQDLAPAKRGSDNQFRDRTRPASELQVNKIAQNLRYREVTDSARMDTGAPTLGQDGAVIGGNGRIMGISRAYELGKADAYRQALLADAARYGLDPVALATMKQPVLVRRFDAPVDVRKAAIASNEGAGADMSALEQARVDAERLPDLTGIEVPESGDLNTGANRNFVRDWVKGFPASKQGSLVDAQGQLSAQGQMRLRNAIIFKAYGDSATLARIVDSADPQIRNVANALIRAAPDVAEARVRISSGTLYPLDLVPSLTPAVEKFAQLKAEGMKVEDYRAQGQLVDDGLDGMGVKLLQSMENNQRSAKSFAEILTRYFNNVRALGDPHQAGIFDTNIPKPEDLLDIAINAVERGGSDLWGQGTIKYHMGLDPSEFLKSLKPVWDWLKEKPVMQAATKFSDSIRMLVSPMELGSKRAMALAVDWANADRKARWQWSQMDDKLKEHFTEDELRDMYNAMDEENLQRLRGTFDETKGLARLPEEQRAVVELMHNYSQQLLNRARAAGMIKSEGVPYWAPRMANVVAQDGEGFISTLDPIGRNLVSTSPSLKHRKHETIEETEAGLKAKFGDQAEVVRNLRVVPLAMARLERAIAGRELINAIKDAGTKAGQKLVSEETEKGFFTLPHPSFRTYGPIIKDGKAVLDEEGNTVLVPKELHVSREFEGPLRAILTGKAPLLYSALMAIKGKSMGLIMYSPLIHNGVEFGRALPLMPGKVLTFRVYFDGNKARKDPELMREAIDNRMVPIGHRAGIQDITGIIEEPNIKPGRSWTAKGVGGAVGLVNKAAGEAVKRGIDKAGDVWHNTLLWDRVADLQAGIYVNMLRAEEARLVKQGFEPSAAHKAAGVEAAHLANRFAGALPNESMSGLARGITNVTLFSRSFSIGNLGVITDMLNGLPKDVRAQLERDVGEKLADAVNTATRRKAFKTFMLDVALMYASNSILQDFFDHEMRNKSLSAIGQSYVERFNQLANKMQEDPAALLNEPLTSIESLSSTSENEPGKGNRALFDYDEKGTAIYVRNPLGKIGEDLEGWAFSPLQTFKNKMSQFARPTMQMVTNDMGFGRQLYDPNDKGIRGGARTMGAIVWNYMKSMVPVDSITSGDKLLPGGTGDRTDFLKVIGPLLGVTFSKGAPGGPAVGEMMTMDKEHRAEVVKVMPDVKELIKKGDQEGAIAAMQSAHMTPQEIKTTLLYAQNPQARLRASNLKRFYETAPDNEKDRMDRFLNSESR